MAPQEETRLSKDMPPPIFEIDPQTGLVSVIEKKTGKVKKLWPIDAREQLAMSDPQIRLASEREAPRARETSTVVDYSNVPLDRLRGYAQSAGVVFTAKPRAIIEQELNAVGFIPPVEAEPETEEEDDG